jgi:hypothetical protein
MVRVAARMEGFEMLLQAEGPYMGREDKGSRGILKLRRISIEGIDIACLLLDAPPI